MFFNQTLGYMSALSSDANNFIMSELYNSISFDIQIKTSQCKKIPRINAILTIMIVFESKYTYIHRYRRIMFQTPKKKNSSGKMIPIPP